LSFKLISRGDRVVTLDVSPLETVAEVKGRLAAAAELSGPLRLVCGGSLLADASTFGSLGLAKESIIHCTEKVSCDH
jgi:hypothetical protein